MAGRGQPEVPAYTPSKTRSYAEVVRSNSRSSALTDLPRGHGVYVYRPETHEPHSWAEPNLCGNEPQWSGKCGKPPTVKQPSRRESDSCKYVTDTKEQRRNSSTHTGHSIRLIPRQAPQPTPKPENHVQQAAIVESKLHEARTQQIEQSMKQQDRSEAAFTLHSSDPHKHNIIMSANSSDYRSKYKTLLEHERREHRRLLTESCDGDYVLKLCDKESDDLSTYAYLSGLQDYQIAYVLQAAAREENIGLVLTCRFHKQTCGAHILRDSITTEDQLHIRFDEVNKDVFQTNFKKFMTNGSIEVHVTFKLKHSYFNSLRRSLDDLPSDVIVRIQPPYSHNLSFPSSETFDVEELSNLDEAQKAAVQSILNNPRNNCPPVLISGPFGTGKTRVLAIAAHMLFKRNTARVLLCTQQRESADNFLLMYLDVVSKSLSQDHVEKLILRTYGKKNPHLLKFYAKPTNLPRDFHREKRLLLVTTCLTAHHLADMHIDFTHIFIDEGAQMREPEAVAALRMAKKSTQIVIAGDPKQVGPSMLVFGRKARDGGLDVSLLERLAHEYDESGLPQKHHHIALETNYRCHEDIIKLSHKLFYREHPLQSSGLLGKKSPVFRLDGKESSLHFVCTSFEDDEVQSSVNKEEANSIVDILANVKQQWPKYGLVNYSPDRVCVMSKSRSQLYTIRGYVKQKYESNDLLNICRIPTFSMQGSEYCVLVLSTSEPVNFDGSPKIDPSKSLCDPHVFNTAITRAESLVVAVGNPVMLLKIEKCVTKDPKYSESGYCWSNFLKHCILNGSISVSEALKHSEKDCLATVKKLVEEQLQENIELAEQPYVTRLDTSYKVECLLGCGGYGVVLGVIRLTDKNPLAIKLKICTKDARRTQEEAKKLRDLEHRNIVRYFNSGLAESPRTWKEWLEFKEERSMQFSSQSSSSTQGSLYHPNTHCFYIVTEWCKKGTLEDMLKSEDTRDKQVAYERLKQVLDALKYIHHSNLAHRDLKPSNIFFTQDNVLKVGDFGLVKEIDEQNGADNDTSDSHSLSKDYGTEYYKSPELRDRLPRSEIQWNKVDIYALGVIVFELLWKMEDRESELSRLFPNSTDPKFPKMFKEKCGNEAVNLILSMTDFDPNNRPDVDKILESEGLLSKFHASTFTRGP